MLVDWNALSEGLQMVISREALVHALEIVAGHAETLASEIEAGGLPDLGGPNALRLLAGITRVNGREAIGSCSRA